MFWGLVLEPGQEYKQDVEASFHLTMAALDPSSVKDSTKNKSASVVACVDKKKYVLCNLDQEKRLQQSLDLVFTAGEEISFNVNGEASVHLTGYLMPDSDLEDMYDMDDMSDEESETETKGTKRKLGDTGSNDQDKKVKLNDKAKDGKADQKNKKDKKNIVDLNDLNNEDDDDEDSEDEDFSGNLQDFLGDEDDDSEDEEDEEMEDLDSDDKGTKPQKGGKQQQGKAKFEKGGDMTPNKAQKKQNQNQNQNQNQKQTPNQNKGGFTPKQKLNGSAKSFGKKGTPFGNKGGQKSDGNKASGQKKFQKPWKSGKK